MNRISGMGTGSEPQPQLGLPADWSTLPSNLPVPIDDGEADHLRAGTAPAVEVPAVALRATGEEGDTIDLRTLSFSGPVLVFVYPRTGRPGVANLEGWDAIPGARGCTPELCGVRGALAELRAARPGVRIVALSTQTAEYQSEVAARLGLPYPILSDAGLALSRALGLPMFEVEGEVLLKRLTLLVHEGRVVGRDYPVFPSDEAARRGLDLLTSYIGKHILNAQVSIRAPCCKQWFDCAECHAETQDHALRKTAEMAFACKKCKKAFRKDMANYDESDEYCPHCDNHYVIDAKTPVPVVGVEGEDARVDARMLKDARVQRRRDALD